MPAIRRRWTAAQVRSLIDQEETAWPRYELLDGELMVTPAPGGIHQVAVAAIGRCCSHLEREPVGVVLASPADLALQQNATTP